MHFRLSVEMIRSVPRDSSNVLRSTSRHFRRFMQLFKKYFQVEKGKYFLYTSNKRVPYGFYTTAFSSVRRETNTSRVVKEFELARTEPDLEFGFQTSLLIPATSRLCFVGLI